MPQSGSLLCVLGSEISDLSFCGFQKSFPRLRAARQTRCPHTHADGKFLPGQCGGTRPHQRTPKEARRAQHNTGLSRTYALHCCCYGRRLLSVFHRLPSTSPVRAAPLASSLYVCVFGSNTRRTERSRPSVAVVAAATEAGAEREKKTGSTYLVEVKG